MEKKHIIGLIAQNENTALHAASDSMGKIFKPLGYTHTIIDLMTKTGIQDLLNAIKKGEVAFTYGFAGVGCDLTLKDFRSIWEVFKTPYLSIWYDHPSYNYKRHMIENKYVKHIYHVEDHYNIQKKYLSSNTIKSAYLLPQVIGVNPHLLETDWEKREKKIFYAKTGINPEQWASDWNRHPDNLKETLIQLAEEVTNTQALDIASRASDLFQQKKLDAKNLDLFMGVIQEVEAYARAWRSDKLVKTLLAHDAVIYGRGWGYLDDLPRKATFKPPFNAHLMPEMTIKYRLCANTNPVWKAGIHERTILGLTSGSLTITDKNELSNNLFSDLPHYYGFNWSDDLNELIAKALKNAENEPISPNTVWIKFDELFTKSVESWSNQFLKIIREIKDS